MSQSQERSLVLVQWVGPGKRSAPDRGDPVPVRVARAFAKRLHGLWLVTHGTSAEAACARIEALCRKENPKAFVGVVSLRSLEDGDDTRAAREALSSGADKIVYRSSMARVARAPDSKDAAQAIVRESLQGRDATDETELAVSCATGTSSMIAAMLAELADAAVDAVEERKASACTVSLARWDTMAQNRGVPTLQRIERIDATRELIGRSTRARARAMRWAPLGVPVLLLGETGAGKTTIAEELSALWWPKRKPAPIRVNCALLEPSLAASELFGAKKGSFTGATATLPGVFGKAASERESTLFLDEFAELPAGTQAKLLTAIEPSVGRDGGRRYRFTPVGDTSEKSIPVEQLRVVLATNRTIDGADGALREDLAARVSQVVLRVAPLRETPAALPALVLAALEEFARGQSPDGAPAPLIVAPDQSALPALIDACVDRGRRWRYNHRDVRRVAIELAFCARSSGRAAKFRGRVALDAADVTVAFRRLDGPAPTAPLPSSTFDLWNPSPVGPYARAIAAMPVAERYEAMLLASAYEESGRNAAAAWRLLIERLAFAPGRSAKRTLNDSSAFLQRWRRVFGSDSSPAE